MGNVVLNPILQRTFRSNPEYELVPFDRLPSDQQLVLKDLTSDPDFYGVLVPQTAGTRTIKSICRDTALLVHTMLHPGYLPSYVQRTLGDQSNEAMAQLVLDGVLEIEHDDRFVSGSEAYPLMYSSYLAPDPQGFLPCLSQDALEYAQALEIDDVVRLSARLYFFNRIPLTTHWTRLLSSEGAVSEFLRISDPAKLEFIHKRWRPVESQVPHNAWFHWQSRCDLQVESRRQHPYKLYVSPVPDSMPVAFRSVVEVLNETAAYSFKVGCSALGLLRPDKFVIYFGDLDELRKAARNIARVLSGCAVQGVPFTAPINDDGLLSWGIDPVPEKGALSWQGSESWRLWITNRLATALVSARNNCPETLQPWQFAVARLRLENIDTDTWTPTKDFCSSLTENPWR
jgi:hypothetical protein